MLGINKSERSHMRAKHKSQLLVCHSGDHEKPWTDSSCPDRLTDPKRFRVDFPTVLGFSVADNRCVDHFLGAIYLPTDSSPTSSTTSIASIFHSAMLRTQPARSASSALRWCQPSCTRQQNCFSTTLPAAAVSPHRRKKPTSSVTLDKSRRGQSTATATAP